MKRAQLAPNKLYLIFLLLLVFNIVATFASPVILEKRDTTSDATADLNPQPAIQNAIDAAEKWQLIVLAIVSILTGVYFCFLGYRFFRLTVFVVGFWFFGNVAYIVLVHAGVTNGTILLIASVVIGIILALFLALCYQIGIYLLGALVGYTFALWLLAFKVGGLIPSRTGQIIFIIVLAVIGLVLSIFFERFLIVVATAFIGAFLIIFGADIFIGTGFAGVVNALLNGEVWVLESGSWKIYAMLAATFVLFIIGFVVQYTTSYRTIGTGYRSGVPSYACGSCACCGRKKAVPPPAKSSWFSRS